MEDDSPYRTPLLTAKASSTDETRITDSTGPKISSCSIVIPGSTAANIVSWKQLPLPHPAPVGPAPTADEMGSFLDANVYITLDLFNSGFIDQRADVGSRF